jgi:D-xylose reductase
MSKTIALRGGGELPVVGLGLWKIPREDTARVVREAIGAGYRHIDAACDYGNEREAGEGIRRAIEDGVCRREDLWITSKLWNTYHAPEHVGAACARSLDDLGLSYLDLYLVHFPIAQRFVPFEERYPPEWFFDPDAADPRVELEAIPQATTWAAMEGLVDEGRARHIGVCNFGTSLLREVMAGARRAPEVLQVELHPYLAQEKLLRFCHQAKIAVTGFSPLGAQSYFALDMADPQESLLEDPAIAAIATNHGRSPAQVAQRWAVQRGTAIVTKTTRPERLAENLALFDFELTDAEMAQIAALDRNRRFNDPGVFAESAFHTFLPIYE